MKIIELSLSFSANIVVAAKSKKEALKYIKSLDVNDLYSSGESVELHEIDVFDVRNPKTKDFNDEAHYVVRKHL